MIRGLLFAAAFCLVAPVSMAQPSLAPPDYVSYHGQLKQGDGSPIDPGAYDVEISIYDAAEGGQMIWGPFIFDGALGAGHAAKAYVMNDGRFSVLLGPTDITNRKLRDGVIVDGLEKRFVQVRIGDLSTAVAITPRQQLLSGTYAFQAFQAAGVGPLINYGDSNFGLAIDTPTARLDVNGNVTASGDFETEGLTATESVADSATFVSLDTKSVVVLGDTTITGDVTGGQLNLENVQQTTFVHQQFSGESDHDIPGTDGTWFCALGRFTSRASNICNVSFNGTTNKWILSARVNEQDGTITCSANCIKMQ